LEIWNHWANASYRTTNHAEGLNSILNKSEIGEMHPSLRNFLGSLQLAHNVRQQRVRKLINGIENPTTRDALYQQLHEEIQNLKLTFYQSTAQIWDQQYFDALWLYNNRPADYQYLLQNINFFLNEISHRIGE
jgi:hypothetical protein